MVAIQRPGRARLWHDTVTVIDGASAYFLRERQTEHGRIDANDGIPFGHWNMMSVDREELRQC